MNTTYFFYLLCMVKSLESSSSATTFSVASDTILAYINRYLNGSFSCFAHAYRHLQLLILLVLAIYCCNFFFQMSIQRIDCGHPLVFITDYKISCSIMLKLINYCVTIFYKSLFNVLFGQI